MTHVSGRSKGVDVARGIAILCIILGHLEEFNINRFVYTFHVPIFFLIAGWFFKDCDLKTLTVKNLKSLIVPYAVTCILIMASAVTINQLINGGG